MRLGSLRVTGLAVAAISFFKCPIACAASFDCNAATAPRERLICGSAALSALDGRLGQIYAQRAALLSAPGAKLLRESERSWLRYAATVCPLNVPEGVDPRRKPETCLTARYNERLEQLAQVGQRVGPFTFNRVDLFAAEAADDGDGDTPGFDIQHVAFPQIDGPLPQAAVAWNSANVKSLTRGGDCGRGDEDTDYRLGFVSAALISLDWTDWIYCHGAPHGFGGTKPQTSLLSPTPHPLTASQLFGGGDGWMIPVQALFWKSLLKSGWTPPDNQAQAVEDGIKQQVVDKDRWFLTKEGLTVPFSSYDGGCYACTPGPVTVAWADLKPFLAQAAPVP